MNTVCLTLVSLFAIFLLCSGLISLPPDIKKNKNLIIGLIIGFYIYHGKDTNWEMEKQACGAWCQKLKF